MRNVEYELKRSCELLLKGKEIWIKLVKALDITKNDMILVLSNSYKKVNLICLKYLAVIKKENDIDQFIVVGREEDRKMVTQYASTRVVFYQMDNMELEAFRKLNSLVKFTDRIIYCNPLEISDKNIFKVLGYNGITLEEIVAHGVLGLDRVTTCDECNLINQSSHMGVKSTTNLFNEKTLKGRILDLIDKEHIVLSDQIVIFGANAYVNKIKNLLVGYDIVAIIDNDKTKSGKRCCDILIYEPEMILGGTKKPYKIIIASSYYKEMKRQLESMGYVYEQDFYIVEMKKNLYDYKLDKLDAYIEDCWHGFEIYKEMCMDYSNTHFFYNQRATGNTYLIGKYLPRYLKNKGIKKYVVLNNSISNHQICNMMGINSLVVVKEDMYSVWKFARLMSGTIGVNFRELCPYDNRSFFINMRTYKGLNFGLIYKLVLYEIDDEEECDVTINQEDSSIYLKENQLREGKTVLLAPYANTVHKLPLEYWESLAECLKRQGYDLCTNCGPMEEPIKGTKRIFIPYSNLIDFVSRCTCVIGMRSGLCDIISGTHTKMIIIYPKNRVLLDEVFDFKYYSLDKMGLRHDNLFEVGVELEEDEWSLEEILQLVEAV